MSADTLHDRIGDRDVVVSVSGGKDSAAACLYLRELGIPFRAVFMDTGWESRLTYDFLRDVLPQHVGSIEWIRAAVPLHEGYEADILAIEAVLGWESPMVRLCVHKGIFPARKPRWCTQSLKSDLFLAWAGDRELVNVVGIRREESQARATALEWEEHGEADNVEQWRPLVTWTLEDVVAIHARHDCPLNPLYRMGAGRVGCYPCIFARKGEIRLIADADPERIEAIRMLESLVARRHRARVEARGEVYTSDGFTWFTADRRVGDPDDHRWPIDRVIEWSRTTHGGRQFELFGPPSRDWACSRWGYCETRPTEDGP